MTICVGAFREGIPQSGDCMAAAANMPHAATVVQFVGADDLTIVCDAFGDPSHNPVLLLHGGGQTRHSWKNTGRKLAAQGSDMRRFNGQQRKQWSS